MVYQQTMEDEAASSFVFPSPGADSDLFKITSPDNYYLVPGGGLEQCINSDGTITYERGKNSPFAYAVRKLMDSDSTTSACHVTTQEELMEVYRGRVKAKLARPTMGKGSKKQKLSQSEGTEPHSASSAPTRVQGPSTQQRSTQPGRVTSAAPHHAVPHMTASHHVVPHHATPSSVAAGRTWTRTANQAQGFAPPENAGLLSSGPGLSLSPADAARAAQLRDELASLTGGIAEPEVYYAHDQYHAPRPQGRPARNAGGHRGGFTPAPMAYRYQ